MSVTVHPTTFQNVRFEASEIEAIAADLLERLGMSDDELVIDLDESTPLAHVHVAGLSPITVAVESGAFEDPKAPRALSPRHTAEVLGRYLLRIRDRREAGFSAAPADDALDLDATAAWDVYSNGRLTRLGYGPHEPRWRYIFRNRHGFTDAADAAFDELWAAESLTWGDLERLSTVAKG